MEKDIVGGLHDQKMILKVFNPKKEIIRMPKQR